MLSKFTSFLLALCISLSVFSQGVESFTNIPGTESGYATRNWVGDNGMNWQATDARTDQTINGKAILIRNGSVTVNAVPNGIDAISFTHQRKFSGADGQLEVLINGVSIGSIAATATETPTTFSNLAISGNFNLEIKQTIAGVRVAVDDVSWESYSVIAACTEPTSQPTGLVLTPGQNSMSGSFTATAPSADEYLILRTTAASLSNSPIDGVSYSAGQILGNATVVAKTSLTVFTDNGLISNTAYRYFVFALNTENCTGGPNYNVINPLTGSSTTLVPTPCTTPGSITNFSLTPANEFVTGSFTAAPNANHYLVVISTSSSLGSFPFDGFNYTAGQVFGTGTVLSFSASTSFTATDLTPNTTYYFFVFSANVECAGAPLYNVNAVSSSTTTSNSSSGIPTGFYNSTIGLTCQPLKTVLKTLSTQGHTQLSYSPGVWNAYQYTDIKPGTPNYIWDIYTDDNNPLVPETFNYVYNTNQCGNYNSEGDCYNREHTMPQSWFDDASPMVTDIHHILPTDGWVNGMRSNFPFGNVSNANYTSIDNQSKRGTGPNNGYSGTVFEPIDAFKGDVARIAFYMATRYEDQIISQNWAGNSEASVAMLSANEGGLSAAERRLQIFDNWYLKTLYDWHIADPVSQKEIDRNNAIYYQSGQGNRNPFVDHPEFVQRMFECSAVLPVTISNFTAQKNSTGILLSWNAGHESNFKHYLIERSEDAVHFEPIGTVAGGNLAQYYFTDNAYPQVSVVYYRLKMVDQDGSFRSSKIVSVRLPSFVQKTIVYPNPNKGLFTVQLSEGLLSGGELMVFDLTGRKLKTTLVKAGESNFEVRLPRLPAGNYFVKIITQQETLHHSFIIMK